MQRLLLFDIDGTLIRMRRGFGAPAVFGVFADMFGVDIPADFTHDCSGKTDLWIFLEIAARFDVARDEVFSRAVEIRERVEAVQAAECRPDTVQVLPGVQEVLNILSAERKISLGLLTGNMEGAGFAKLRPHALDVFFHFGAFGSDHHLRNELPPIALNRARDLHPGIDFRPERSLIIGDTHRDIECARAGGMKAAAVATGRFNAEELGRHAPDALFNDLSAADTAEQLLRLL